MLIKRLFVNYRLELINFLVGAAVLAFELTASRIVAPYIGTSIYVWTSIIGVILGALALGYSLGGRIADKRHRSEDVIGLLILSAALMLLTTINKDGILRAISQGSLPPQWQALLVSLLLFALPTVVLGMISPYLARLNITSVATSGRKVASISTWGTIGSLFGTFMTGYVLFGFVGTRNMLAFIALALILVSFTLPSRRYLRYQLLGLLATIVMIGSVFPLQISGVVHDLDTRYSRVMVRDMGPVRALQVDQFYTQTGVYKNGSPELVSNYTHAFAAVAAAKPTAKSYLVIGGGAFAFPMYLQRQTTASIDVVEIDGQLQDISKQYFGFRPDPGRMKVHITDGRQHINTATQRYDVIFVDAYSSGDPPFQLFTQEAVARMKDHLNPGGFVAVNVISPAGSATPLLLRSIVSTYKESFAHVAMYQANGLESLEQNQNLILVASQSKLDVSGLNSVAVTQPGMVFRDDFTPLERLVKR